MKRTMIRILVTKSHIETLLGRRNTVKKRMMRPRYRRRYCPRRCRREVCRHHRLHHHLETRRQTGEGGSQWICPALRHPLFRRQRRMRCMTRMITIRTSTTRHDTSHRRHHRNQRIRRHQPTPLRHREVAQVVDRALIWPVVPRRVVGADLWTNPGLLQST